MGEHCLNRTNVELKPVTALLYFVNFKSLNRTNVELKLVSPLPNDPAHFRLNRTNVELKQNMRWDFVAFRVRVLIEPT